MILLNATGGGMPFLLMMGAMFIVMYFFMIRPQIKKQKRESEYRSKLKKGDKITTIGGVYGKIIDVIEDTVVIEVHGGTTLKLQKSAVSMTAEPDLGQK